MKKFLKFAAVLAAMFMVLSCFVACGGGVSTASVDTPAIDTVDKAEGLKAPVKDEKELEAVIGSMAEDGSIKALVELIGGAGAKIPSIPGMSKSIKGARETHETATIEDLGKLFDTYSKEFEKFAKDLDENGKASISIDEEVKEVDLGDYKDFGSIKNLLLVLDLDAEVEENFDESTYTGSGSEELDASLKLAADTTVDVKALAKEFDFETGFGKITCNIAVNTKVDYESEVKVTATSMDSSISGSVEASYAMALGFPYVDADGKGGRFVITLDASVDADVSAIENIKTAKDAEDFITNACDVELEITVYDNDGTQTFTVKYDTEALIKMVEGMMSEE